MTRPPFQSARHLPADLAGGLWRIIAIYAEDTWLYIRPRLSRTLTRWGARLA